MPINRIARVATQSALDYPGVRANSVPFAYNEQYGEFAFTDPDGNARHIPWMQAGLHTENLIRYEWGTLTNAQIKALRATPATIVADPEGGKVLELISLLLFLDYGSNVLTESADNLELYYNGGTTAAASATIEATGFIDNNADIMYHVYGKTLGALAKTVVDGKGFILKNSGDGEYAGNAGADTVIRYRVAYRVHQAGW
jgi:hypothetical protein